jgi:hypothetical protein
MSDFQESEYFQIQQQRFEAALKFATTDCTMLSNGTYMKPCLSDAVKMADDLIAKLEQTRTLPAEDTEEIA